VINGKPRALAKTNQLPAQSLKQFYPDMNVAQRRIRSVQHSALSLRSSDPVKSIADACGTHEIMIHACCAKDPHYMRRRGGQPKLAFPPIHFLCQMDKKPN
jgi:hypothetical protein